MKNWKYVTFAGLMMLGMMGGAVACGDSGAGGGGGGPQTCTQASDCDSGACDQECGVCVGTPCPLGTECTGSQVCRAFCAGGTPQCLEGTGGTGGTGGGGGTGGTGGTGAIPCTDDPACRVVSGYCATTNECASFECMPGVADAFNKCTKCGKGPDDGALGTDGPVVYWQDGMQQLDVNDDANLMCRVDLANCNQGHVCKFQAFFIAADGHPVSNSSPYTKHIFQVGDKSTSCTKDGDCDASVPLCKAGACVSYTFSNTGVSLSNGTVTFETCVPDTNANPNPVLLLLDDAGDHSNSLCLNGTNP